MTYAQELAKHSTEIKAQIRKLENVKYKLLRSKWSTIFNKICLKENLLPDYTKNNSMYNNENKKRSTEKISTSKTKPNF